ncbi:uncharacterized protein K452DRAFT_359297 [Aplosporella prunicola CBS 121167]|uniref:SET domain-containing protein n=1 Tax=Aplosporella prunicola CBS 121167 TaxID=1176127 RepID=A0A6A6B9V6_9PEZI|nr:uncharacterized protein K452DRAFT_359297 [Aplosporella prunicola CBS 121167]KAF2140850.1 hypothetical protein K452DRAFT_359297 [Aplosporella prunicola CBS 121167]
MTDSDIDMTSFAGSASNPVDLTQARVSDRPAITIDLTGDSSEDEAGTSSTRADTAALTNNILAHSPTRNQNIETERAPSEATARPSITESSAAAVNDASPLSKPAEPSSVISPASSDHQAPAKSIAQNSRLTQPGNPFNKQPTVPSGNQASPLTDSNMSSGATSMGTQLHNAGSDGGLKRQKSVVINSSDDNHDGDDNSNITEKGSSPLPARVNKLTSRPRKEISHEQAESTHVPDRTDEVENVRSNNADDSPRVSPAPPEASVAQAKNDPATITSLNTDLEIHLKQLHEDHEYFARNRLMRARMCYRVASEEDTPVQDLASGPSIVPPQFLQDAFPWPEATSILKQGTPKPSETKKFVERYQDIYMNGTTKNSKTTSLYNHFDQYATDGLIIPDYTNYVSLKQNLLAESIKTLLYEPYFSDDQSHEAGKQSLWDELRQRFTKAFEERPRRVLQAQKSFQYRSYAEAFFQEIGCQMSDVLNYLLMPEAELRSKLILAGLDDHKVDNLVQTVRPKSCQEDFDRDKPKWLDVYDTLPESTPDQLSNVCLACEAWRQRTGFSIWHIARRSSFAQIPGTTSPSQQKSTQDTSSFTYRSLACRVCHLHNCPFHGEIVEEHRSARPRRANEDPVDDNPSRPSRSRRSSVSSDSSEASECSTSTLMNVKKHVNAPPREEADDDVDNGPRRTLLHWQTRSKTHLVDKRPPFFPCSHEGTCDTSPDCTCRKNNITCEKTCACSISCRRRFRGCNCAQVGTICWQNEKCDCFGLNRECDPDLCATCGAAEVLDPVNRYNDAVAHGKCANVSIQRNVPKRTLLGLSEVQGFGLFMGEPVKEFDYLGEYKGETLTKMEGSRRGAIYQQLLTNYLFDLNKDQEVDSTRAGNKFRFINNSALAPNCTPKLLLCNTVVRIGMFAAQDIKKGEELFFNYNYPANITKGFRERAGVTNSAAASKNKRNKNKATSAVNGASASFSESSSSSQAEHMGPGNRSYGGLGGIASTPLRSSTITNLASIKRHRPKRNAAKTRNRAPTELAGEAEDDQDEEYAGGGVEDTDEDDYGDPTDDESNRPRKRGRKRKDDWM